MHMPVFIKNVTFIIKEWSGIKKKTNKKQQEQKNS
jgi:hypothetical protein